MTIFYHVQGNQHLVSTKVGFLYCKSTNVRYGFIFAILTRAMAELTHRKHFPFVNDKEEDTLGLVIIKSSEHFGMGKLAKIKQIKCLDLISMISRTLLTDL